MCSFRINEILACTVCGNSKTLMFLQGSVAIVIHIREGLSDMQLTSHSPLLLIQELFHEMNRKTYCQLLLVHSRYWFVALIINYW